MGKSMLRHECLFSLGQVRRDEHGALGDCRRYIPSRHINDIPKRKRSTPFGMDHKLYEI